MTVAATMGPVFPIQAKQSSSRTPAQSPDPSHASAFVHASASLQAVPLAA
jgi:hypothetical protein